MQKTEEKKKREVERYCCPNPNCNRVFSRPKIIKYYVCPTCQTLLKMDTAQGNVKKKKRGPTEADIKRKEAERLEAERKAEQLETELKAERKKTEQKAAQREAERVEAEQKAKQIAAELLEAERKANRLEAERKETQMKVERLETERLEAKRKESERLKAERLEAPSGKYFALVIGNNDYKYLKDLTTAKNDATEVLSILKQEYGFDTRILMDAKRHEILNAINDFRYILGANDHFLIYYAGWCI